MTNKPLGFWACWSLTVGVMVGSGIFLLPSVLAPFGTLSFLGWVVTAGGSILIALVFARLSSRITKSGSVYVYSRDAFGDLPGFLIAWSYWTSYWVAIPGGAIAFVGYLSVFHPDLSDSRLMQLGIGLVVIWTSILLNIKGVKEATFVQLVLTVLKLLPLALIIVVGVASGSTDNFPDFNPKELPVFEALATTVLLTLWAFSGMEAGAISAGDVQNPEKTVPRAIVFGTLTVAFIYIGSTAAVMSLVPAEVLVNSTAPFADAAASLGAWGPTVIAIGALFATYGSMHGIIYVAGQMPMALAVDRFAPKTFARKNSGGAPFTALLVVGVLASLLLIGNYSKGLISAYRLIITMSTLAFLLPLVVCSLAELKHSWRSSRGWAGVALIALLYSLFAVIGSGWEVISWGVLLMLAGLPIYWWSRGQSRA
ncbi:MAG: amino acid permease [Arenicella sp.]|nr:amino acid permease [Arenicella sp.]